MIDLIDLVKHETQWLDVLEVQIRKSLLVLHKGFYTEIEDEKAFLNLTNPTQVGVVDENKSSAEAIFIKIDIEVHELLLLESLIDSEVDNTFFKLALSFKYNGEVENINLEYIGLMELVTHDNDVYLMIT